MKVKKLQANSKMCIICGMENEAGVKAPFYEMEDDSVWTIFQFKEFHQSYPYRVHGGMISAMHDELGLRSLWVYEPDMWGVTTSLEIKYRKPVPYEVTLKGVGKVIKNTKLFLVCETKIFNLKGELLSEGVVKYLKMKLSDISSSDAHDEMIMENKFIREEIED